MMIMGPVLPDPSVGSWFEYFMPFSCRTILAFCKYLRPPAERRRYRFFVFFFCLFIGGRVSTPLRAHTSTHPLRRGDPAVAPPDILKLLHNVARTMSKETFWHSTEMLVCFDNLFGCFVICCTWTDQAVWLRIKKDSSASKLDFSPCTWSALFPLDPLLINNKQNKNSLCFMLNVGVRLKQRKVPFHVSWYKKRVKQNKGWPSEFFS